MASSRQVFPMSEGGSAAVAGGFQLFDPTPNVDFTGGSAQVTFHLDTWLAVLQRANVRRWTDADLRAEYPDDEGLKFVAAFTQKTLTLIPAWRYQV